MRSRIRVMATFVAAPLLAVGSAWRSVREHGRAVASRYGVSRARQFLDLWWLRSRHGIEPESYYLYRLHLPERRRRAEQYVQVSELDRLAHLVVYRCAADDSLVLSDKRRFTDWCAAHSFPSVGTLMQVDPDGTVNVGSGARRLPAADLFSKVTSLRSAQGARVWRHCGDSRWVDDGAALDGESLIELLRAEARTMSRPIVLQRRLVNHPALAHLTNGSLSTVRVVTLREPGGDPFVLLAACRMGVGESIADNLSQGGMAAPVDLASGRLGTAVRMNPPLYDECDVHPATAGRISGTVVPFWDDVVSLAVRAHRELPRIACVGWDVAALTGGPVIVEGNRFPSARLSQVASGVPLGDTPFVECLNRHLRASFGLVHEEPSATSRASASPTVA